MVLGLLLAQPVGSLRAQQSGTIVAVFPVEDATGRLPATSLDALSNYLAGRIGQIPGFSIVPTSDLRARIGQEKIDSYKECFDQSCQIEIGREVAAAKVVAARINALGTGCVISAYLFDLVRAATDATATART